MGKLGTQVVFYILPKRWFIHFLSKTKGLKVHKQDITIFCLLSVQKHSLTSNKTATLTKENKERNK